MIWLYRILFPVAFLLLLPRFLLRMWKRGGYRGSTAQRLGISTPPRRSDFERTRIWVHAVSVGELGIASSLIQDLRGEDTMEFVLTTTTSTGYRLATERLSGVCEWIGWFPLDFAPCSRRFWKSLRPDAAILIESELWPEHLHQAWRARVPVFLVNARISDRSMHRLNRCPSRILKAFLRPIHRIFAATPQDADRWRTVLGPDNDKVIETGNLKLDVAIQDETAVQIAQGSLIKEFGFYEQDSSSPEYLAGRPRILFGNSTWPGEEELLLDVIRMAHSEGIDCRLALVPRHAERRDAIRRILEASDLPFHFRSVAAKAPSGTIVYVADTTGELAQLLSIADVCFVGKSIPPNEGGQNPIEAIACRKAVVFGSQMTNFRDIAHWLVLAGGACQGLDRNAVCAELLRLIRDADARARIASAGCSWLAKHNGARKRTVDLLRSELTGAQAVRRTR